MALIGNNTCSFAAVILGGHYSKSTNVHKIEWDDMVEIWGYGGNCTDPPGGPRTLLACKTRSAFFDPVVVENSDYR